MLEKLLPFIFKEKLDVRERIFRLTILASISFAVVGMIETIFLTGVSAILIPLGILFVSMSIASIATFKYNKIDFAATMVAIVISVFVFPLMFFLCGGVNGGAPIWFGLALFFCFMMFKGKKLHLLFTLAITVDAACYLIAYYYPSVVINIDSEVGIYVDSMFSVVCVGIAGGVFFKLYSFAYEEERSVVLKQIDEIEKISKGKNSFFASMSHEFRTPINSIIGINEMILRESMEEQTREYAYNIKNASQMLLSIVNDILDISRIEMQKMEIVPNTYETKKFIQNLVNIIRVPLTNKQLEFIIDVDENLPTKLWGDEKRMQQIVINLLTNAVKYTEEGTVTLSVSGEIIDEETLSLTVKVIDTGIGIRKEDVASLYNIFSRIDTNRNNKVEGSGLGLSITKQLVELMGGTISVDSIYTKGSTFTVNVTQTIVDKAPMGNVEYIDDSNLSRDNYYKKQFEAPEARVLIVDDNKMNAMVAAKLLGETKVQIDIANGGLECLERTKQKYYHVILLDNMMPDLSGPQTLRRIRMQENGLCKESAIVAMTASEINDVENLYENSGFDGYLEKPIQADVLESTVQKFIPEEIIEYRRDIITEAEKDSDKDISDKKGRRRKKIYISTDCVSDLPRDILKTLDIRLMYLYIKTKEGRFADTREISSDILSEQIYGKMDVYADSVSVEEYEEFFAQVLTEAEEVIHISMASKAGKSYDVAIEAAKSFDHVHVIDSGHISCGEGLIVMYAAKLANEGLGVNRIIELVTEMKTHVHTQFVLPSAETIYQRGYTGKLTARVFGILRIRPLFVCKNSEMVVRGGYIGELERAWKVFIEKNLRNRKKVNQDIIFVTFAGLSVKQQEFIRNEIEKRMSFDRIIIQKASVSNACNGGVYSIGMAYYKND